MLNLTRAIDRATGYVFVPPPGAGKGTSTGTGTGASVGANESQGSQMPERDADADADVNMAGPSTTRENTYALMSSAMGPRVGLRSDVRDVQERWVDAREEWDAHERAQWRREGEAMRRAAAEVEKQRKLNVRERK